MVSTLLALEVYRFSFSYLLQFGQKYGDRKKQKKDFEVIVGLSVLGSQELKEMVFTHCQYSMVCMQR